MEWWQIAIVVWVLTLGVLAIAALLLWRNASTRSNALRSRLGKLPWRLRIELAALLMRDGRVPLAVRAIPPLLILYLAMPFDLIPDVIPVLGQLDDLVVVGIALALITRFVPLHVIEEHLSDLEASAGNEKPA